jgi:putative ABC transport system ATP-binding protein
VARVNAASAFSDRGQPMAALIQLRNLAKIYQSGDSEFAALHDVNLDIERGDFVAITGSSGSGKSTLMNLLGCLDSPSRGSYLLADRDVAKLSRVELARTRNEFIGFVFQNFNLLSASCSRTSTCCRVLRRWRTSSCR